MHTKDLFIPSVRVANFLPMGRVQLLKAYLMIDGTYLKATGLREEPRNFETKGTVCRHFGVFLDPPPSLLLSSGRIWRPPKL